MCFFFFFSSRRRHTRCLSDWSSDVCSSDLGSPGSALLRRSFRKTFPPAVRGEGAYLWDARGKQYLDLAGSAAVNFIGHGVSEIVSAMTEQARSVEIGRESCREREERSRVDG